MAAARIKGVLSPVVTPFKRDGSTPNVTVQRAPPGQVPAPDPPEASATSNPAASSAATNVGRSAWW